MNSKTKEEPWRTLYIRLLTTPINDDDFLKNSQALQDLIDAGFMRGRLINVNHGNGAGGSINGITFRGRLFAEEQIKIIKAESMWGRIKSGAGLLVGWLAGVLSALIAA